MKYIHIAGTNAKGSVAEYVSKIIMASGASCGCFTSPHLFSPTERMSLNGNNISQKSFDELMQKVKAQGLAVNETLFARYTAAAFLWFEKQKPEYVVLETGLGGRFDPTNVIEDKIAILTPISYDHMQYLGDDIRDIAKEKCGIIKQGNIVISAKQTQEVASIIRDTCKKQNARLIIVEDVEVLSCNLAGQVFRYKGKEFSIRSIGNFQPQNATVAIECAKVLGIDYNSIKEGLGNSLIKARTQYVEGKPPMLIDGAHNPAAVSMLVDTLKTQFNDKNKVLLFGCMQDKDYEKMIEILAKHFEHVIIVSADIQRGADVHELQSIFAKFSDAQIEIDIPAGVSAARELAIQNNALLVVCGSLYLAGSKFIQNTPN